MHFVDMNKVDLTVLAKLNEYKEKTREKWENYFNKIGDMPDDAAWNDPIIKQALVNKYQKNCGYCGSFTDETTTPINKNKTYNAETDHHIPKSKNIDKIYDWSNFVWSCIGCNKHKLSYYVIENMILSPSCKEDVDLLKFIDGYYKIDENLSIEIKNRYEITNDKTMLNIHDRIKLRRTFAREIKNYLTDIYLKIDEKNQIDFLKEKFETSGFKLLFRDVLLPDFKKENPDFEYTAKDFGID